METGNIGHGPSGYKIRVKGHLGAHWSDWFEGMTIESRGSETILTGQFIDQSALHGLLIRIRDLGLPLICVKRMDSVK